MCESSSLDPDFENEYDVSDSSEEGMMVDASGVEEYRSWRRVRPSEMTGVVAYIGIRVNRGKCLQQWA